MSSPHDIISLVFEGLTSFAGMTTASLHQTVALWAEVKGA